MPQILALSAELNLHTCCENQIKNEIDREPPRAGDILASADYQKLFPKALHRPGGPSRRYNCHGLSFASRRTVIWEASEIAKVLADDGYVEVKDFRRVLPGDIAAYTSQLGDIEHSGIVVSVDALFVPSILSKWGMCHEVIHKLAECPYDSSNVKFYRVMP